MRKVIILDNMSNEIHVFTLPVENYDNPKAFVLDQYSQEGETFKEAWIEFMVVDLSETEGRLPIYIH